MVRLIITSSTGQTRTIEARSGTSVMEAARNNGVEGIIAECGGACSCATCHVHVADDWLAKLPERSGTEADMLDFADNLDVQRSRLSCQISMTADLDGLEVSVPD